MTRYKLLLPIMLFLFCISIVCGEDNYADTCGEEIYPNVNCTMTTPSIAYCGIYNYTIFNASGGVTEEGNLTQLENNIYYLYFKKDVGDYIVSLCDDTTRKIKVTQEVDAEMMMAIIIGMIALIAFLIFFGSKVSSPTIKYFAYVLASIEAVLIAAGIYAISISADWSVLLQVNMWVFGLVMLGLLLWSLSKRYVDMGTGEDEGTESLELENKGWKRGWDK